MDQGSAHLAGHYGGGIRSLHQLLKEHGEAVEYDLIDRGLRLRDLGKPWFSWPDLRAIVSRASSDPSMQLHRAMNPDWRFADPATFLLAEMATIMSWQRYVTVSPRYERPEDVPQMFLPATYGPASAEDDSSDRTTVESDSDARARAAAAEIRAAMAG